MNAIERLQQQMLPEMEAVFIEDVSNRFYLTGMRSSAGSLLVTKQKAWLLIDFRYLEEAEKKAVGCSVIEQTELSIQLRELLYAQGIRQLSVCTSKMTLQRYSELYGNLFDVRIDCSDALSDLLEALRMNKTEEELGWHRRAQQITDQTFSHICDFLRPGLTELEIAQEIGTTLTRLGSDDKHFNFIVASGENGSLPHGFATRRVVKTGELITMDFGAQVNGRIADMTRTVALGSVQEEYKKAYETVLEAQKRALEAIRPGACCRKVDRIARDYINTAGYNGCFSHGLGHSVGVDVHENPRFNSVCNTTLEPGMVMTVEPGIYVKNRYGIRIEDMIAITSNGFENFTTSEKQLLQL